MRTIETAAAVSSTHKSGIRWGRVIIAAFLSELAVIAVISAIMVVYMFAVAPGRSSAEYGEFGQNAGYYVSAPAAAIATFLIAFRAIRKLDSAFVANGALVGIVATLLTVGFIFGARPQDRVIYIASFVLRIVAGYSAGLLVRSMKEDRR
jgi:hypothetical protein